MERQVITAPGAPAAVGPYSHAVRAGDLLFCSGQLALDPESGDLVGDTPAEQVTHCLRNLEAICAAAGTRLARAVKLTVLLTDLSAFGEVNDAYTEFFAADDAPARIAYGVVALPRGAQVEVDAVVAV